MAEQIIARQPQLADLLVQANVNTGHTGASQEARAQMRAEGAD